MELVQVYLTRRNLLTLLAKLDRNVREGEKVSQCTICKRDTQHKTYPQSHAAIYVTALEDEEYYDRAPGVVHREDVPA